MSGPDDCRDVAACLDSVVLGDGAEAGSGSSADAVRGNSDAVASTPPPPRQLLRNTLVDVKPVDLPGLGQRVVYMSFWMNHPADAGKYNKLPFVTFELRSQQNADGAYETLRILMDEISAQWLHKRPATFEVEPAADNAFRVTGMLVGDAPDGAENAVPLAVWVSAKCKARQKHDIVAEALASLRSKNRSQ